MPPSRVKSTFTIAFLTYTYFGCIFDRHCNSYGFPASIYFSLNKFQFIHKHSIHVDTFLLVRYRTGYCGNIEYVLWYNVLYEIFRSQVLWHIILFASLGMVYTWKRNEFGRLGHICGFIDRCRSFVLLYQVKPSQAKKKKKTGNQATPHRVRTSVSVCIQHRCVY